jgi:hypothetical protein
MSCDYLLLPPPHCRIIEYQDRVLLVSQDGGVYVEISPDGYDPQTNLPIWESPASRAAALNRASALANLITYAHNFRGLKERLS